jgi:hypothetical protein
MSASWLNWSISVRFSSFVSKAIAVAKCHTPLIVRNEIIMHNVTEGLELFGTTRMRHSIATLLMLMESVSFRYCF